MHKFFREINVTVGLYYGDILLCCGWETVTGVNNLTVQDLILYGKRCYKINKENFKSD